MWNKLFKNFERYLQYLVLGKCDTMSHHSISCHNTCISLKRAILLKKKKGFAVLRLNNVYFNSAYLENTYFLLG